MKKISMCYMFSAILLALVMVLAAVQPVAAQEAGTEVEIMGTITAIDEGAGSFTVETEDGQTHTVFPAEGFDFSILVVGESVEVEGTLNEDGTISALQVRVEQDDDPVEEDDDPATGYFCMQSERPHPFGARLAERYDVEYETLQEWFCDGFGWGQVMLALQTGQITGEDPEALLEARRGGQGWGQIWQELKLIGRPEHAGPPNDEDGNGRPDFAGPPDDEDGNGRPDFAGPPDHAGPPDDKGGRGRPDFAGPPSDRP